MPPAYDLILQRHGELQIETVQVRDAAEAWRVGRDQYPDSIRGVVCREGPQARHQQTTLCHCSQHEACHRRHPKEL